MSAIGTRSYGRPGAVAVRPSPQRAVVVAGLRGAQGKQGLPGGSSFTRTVGEPVSALRVVYELDGRVYVLSSADAGHIDLLLGVTITAAAGIGDSIEIQRSGDIEDSGWSWQPGRIWLGSDGRLTQIPPTEGFDVLIGTAVSGTRVILNIQDAIKL